MRCLGCVFLNNSLFILEVSPVLGTIGYVCDGIHPMWVKPFPHVTSRLKFLGDNCPKVVPSHIRVRGFPPHKLVIIPKLKSPVCPTIYP